MELSLPIPACPEHESEEALGDFRIEPALGGHHSAVRKQGCFAAIVSNGHAGRPFDRGNLAYDLMSLGEKFHELVVNLINSISQDLEGRGNLGVVLVWISHH
jgi:hypothetical protein